MNISPEFRKDVFVFDEGKSTDRYTVIMRDGCIYGCSGNPFHPQGIGTYCGDVDLLEGTREKDRSERFVASAVAAYVKKARRNKNLGKEIKDWDALPEKLREFIVQKYIDLLESNVMETLEKALREAAELMPKAEIRVHTRDHSLFHPLAPGSYRFEHLFPFIADRLRS